jgi:hypothetical protein
MVYRSLIISIVLCFFSSCDFFNSSPQNETTLQKACNYLWSKQSEDGAWHSETHGILKGGESLTAFLLWTLLEVPETAYRKSSKKVERGLKFIRKHINSEGVLGLSDEYVMDYPNYATSYALRILLKYGTEKDEVLIQKMKKYLLSQQFTEQREIQTSHLAYGAWGFGEELEKGMIGHVDLSHTRRVLQALIMTENTPDSSFLKAKNFLLLLQKHPSEKRLQPTKVETSVVPYNGGFYASSVTLGTNKGGILNEEQSEYFASYATATCDGLLALLASGYSKNDEQVQSAFNWLLEHPELNFPEGMDQSDSGQWHLVMVFYHLAARAEAYKAVNHKGSWIGEMQEIITERQLENGSFSNPNGGPNKENDPLLATAFAIIALTN